MMSLVLFGLAGVVLQLGVMMMLMTGQKEYGIVIDVIVTLVFVAGVLLCGLLVLGGLTLAASPI